MTRWLGWASPRPAALPGHDYVIIARPAVLTCPFTTLLADLDRAFRSLARRLRGDPDRAPPLSS
jgi:RNase P protein component